MSNVGLSDLAARLIHNIETVIVGKREAVELAVATLLSGGHMLIEDIPGVGKTTLARALAKSVHGQFKRIQFTPDLLPADITGVSIYNQAEGRFEFRPGPVFANVLLADEINRATPKSQSALLEAMEEFQVTADGETRDLPVPFFVVATENPIEYEGTYSLPEAQLDRFMTRVSLGYPSRQEEVDVLTRQQVEHPITRVEPVASAAEIVELQRAIRGIHVHDSLKDYMVALTQATRTHPDVELGASPRGSIALMRLSQAVALLADRDFTVPDDVKRVALPALAHRVIIRPERRIQGVASEDVVSEILATVPVPVGPEGRRHMTLGKRHALLWGPLFILIVAFVLHVNQMFVMFVALGLLAPASFLLGRHKLLGLTVSRHGRSVLTAGEQTDVSLTVSNESHLRRFFIVVRDTLPAGLESPQGGEVLVADLPAGADVHLSYKLLARRRGVYQVGPLALEGADYLGLYRFTRRVGQPVELLVYPYALTIPNLWRRSMRGRTAQRSRRRMVGQSGELYGVRDYLPGDDLRRVDWKTSARRDRLAVVEAEQLESMEAVVLLDLRAGVHAGQGYISTLEYGASLAASLAVEALGRGCSVGLVSAGAQDHSVLASAGTRQRLLILESLARAQADGGKSLGEVLTAHQTYLPPACSVALISADPSAELMDAITRLQALGHTVTWFALARHTFDRAHEADRMRFGLAVAEAAARGASVHQIVGDAPLQASLLRRAARGRRG